ncbi:LOW QUALITY PROTEIN: 5-hydroxytryptamine receptor 4 [Caloenas nicobarica]
MLGCDYEAKEESCPETVFTISSETFGVAEKIVLLTFVSAVILMAILGNLLVMVSVCRDRQLRKIKTNCFIVSLAFADLLVSVLVMPFGAIELVQDNWIYGEMFCLVRTSLDVLLTTASILHLCCISLDRYYAICCQPLVYRNKMTPLRIAVMLGGCWVIPTFISFLPIMQGWNSIGIIDLIQQRQFNKASNSTYCIFMVNKPYAITCSVVAFYIPFLLMVLAYYRIYVTAREHARQIRVLQRAGAPGDGRQHPPDQHSTHRMKTETKAAKTLCIIMGCFCLCWAPFFITNIVDPFINYTVPGKLWTAFLWLGYINSGLNPFLYAFLNKSFRRAFLIILCCGVERYRRPSILGQTVPCSTTTINGSTHVLRSTRRSRRTIHKKLKPHCSEILQVSQNQRSEKPTEKQELFSLALLDTAVVFQHGLSNRFTCPAVLIRIDKKAEWAFRVKTSPDVVAIGVPRCDLTVLAALLAARTHVP